MPQNFYELVWIFIIYAIIGWCTEVSYAALDTGKFVNRGFLNGPYCPVYGCGVVIVITILTPLKHSLLILFIGSVILTTVLEFITGYLLEKVFHNQWWDYSDYPFNIKGYVCLKFSIYWGLACTFIMNVLHPIIYKGIRLLPHLPGVILLGILMVIFLVDCGITVSTILKFNKRLKVMDEIASKIHWISDEIGENIYENVFDVIEKSEEFQENHAELLNKISQTAGAAKTKLVDTTETARAKITDTTENARTKFTDKTEAAKLAITENVMEARSEWDGRKAALEKEREELTLKYQKMSDEKNGSFKRLLKAFPDMKSRDNNITLQDLKKHFNIRQSREKMKEDK